MPPYNPPVPYMPAVAPAVRWLHALQARAYLLRWRVAHALPRRVRVAGAARARRAYYSGGGLAAPAGAARYMRYAAHAYACGYTLATC